MRGEGYALLQEHSYNDSTTGLTSDSGGALFSLLILYKSLRIGLQTISTMGRELQELSQQLNQRSHELQASEANVAGLEQQAASLKHGITQHVQRAEQLEIANNLLREELQVNDLLLIARCITD